MVHSGHYIPSGQLIVGSNISLLCFMMLPECIDKHLLILHGHILDIWVSECHRLQFRQVSRTGFLTRLKSNKVGISKGKTSRVIVREKLSKRAVMKEDGLGRMYLQERRLTPIGT